MEHTATGGGPIEIQLEQKSEENRKLSDEEFLKELLHVTHACIIWGRDTNRVSYAKPNALYTLLDQIERDQPLDFDPSLKEAIGHEYEWRLVRKELPVLQ